MEDSPNVGSSDIFIVITYGLNSPAADGGKYCKVIGFQRCSSRSSPPAKAMGMSVRVNLARCTGLDDTRLVLRQTWDDTKRDRLNLILRLSCKVLPSLVSVHITVLVYQV
jgi:hypothetical protein